MPNYVKTTRFFRSVVSCYSTKSNIGSAAYSLKYDYEKVGKIRFGKGIGSGKAGQLLYVRDVVATLMLKDRIEMNYERALVCRNYAERLIQEAIIRGPDDPFNMELMKFWLQETSLIEKMFNILVPRYISYDVPYTNIYKLSRIKKECFRIPENCGCLELKGNDLPVIETYTAKLKRINGDSYINSFVNDILKNNK